MKPNRLVGHELPDEGRIRDPFGPWGLSNGKGATRCSCGQGSPLLPSTAARRRWHRKHKDAIRAQRAGTGGEAA
jgi:hypothetical protein